MSVGAALLGNVAHTLVCATELDNAVKHLKLGEACLNIENQDASTKLQLWAQAVECYTCPPWLYLDLDPGSSHALAVNTTYPTHLYIRDENKDDLYSLTYHFGEYGSYYLGINSYNNTSIYTTVHPHKQYLALFLAFFFYFMLAFMWQCTKLLRKRMDSPNATPPPTHVPEDNERSPLLSSSRRSGSYRTLGAANPYSSSTYNLDSSYQPSTSSALTSRPLRIDPEPLTDPNVSLDPGASTHPNPDPSTDLTSDTSEKHLNIDSTDTSNLEANSSSDRSNEPSVSGALKTEHTQAVIHESEPLDTEPSSSTIPDLTQSELSASTAIDPDNSTFTTFTSITSSSSQALTSEPTTSAQYSEPSTGNTSDPTSVYSKPSTSGAHFSDPSTSPTFHSQPSFSPIFGSRPSNLPGLSSDPSVSPAAVTQYSPVPSAPVPDNRRAGGRLKSLDAFRGLAIVLMIFVNYGGGKYWFFSHARWNGLTVADLVFPWFLWIMGTSLVFSVRSQLRRATKRHIIVLKIFKRCITLFALGIIVNSTNGHNYMPTFRILGVLQRFALCYLLTAVIEVYCMNPQESPEYVRYWKVRDIVRSSAQWCFTILLVAAHIIITFALPVPGCPTGYLGPGGLHLGGLYGNCTGGAAGYIDRLLLGSDHVYSHPSSAVIYNSDTPYDPEGFLGVLTSVLMVQFGAACGRIILTFPSHGQRTARWMIWGTVCGAIAGILCFFKKEGGPIPINKNLWSLSFVLCTACFAFYLFTAFYVFIDHKDWWNGNPFRYAGMNAILLYVGHELCGGLFPWSWRPVGQYHADYLIMNLWGMSIWVVVAYVLHTKKLYLSV